MSESMSMLNRPAAPVTELQFEGDGNALVQHLSRQGLKCEEMARNQVRLLSDREQDLQVVWQVANQLGITIQSMNPTKNSLEQIFMSAVRGESDAPQ